MRLRREAVPKIEDIGSGLGRSGASAPIFDIVNGFFDRCRDGVGCGSDPVAGAVDKKAEIISAFAAAAFCRVALDRKFRTLSAVVGGVDSQA